LLSFNFRKILTFGMELTQVEARYLQLLYRRQEEEGRRAGTLLLAREMGVRPATVTEVLKRLAAKGLLRHVPYRGVELTPSGRRVGRELLRRHRILEVLFVRLLGCDRKTACREASRLDSHISPSLVDSLCRWCGHPTFCPCGRPIQRCRGE